MDRTFVMLKPETVERMLTGEILTRIEGGGLRIAALKMLRVTEDLAAQLYEVHLGKPFYSDLIKHITSGPVVAMVVEGEGVVAAIRKMIGATDPAKAETGTIRKDFGLSITKNAIHASDGPENAEKELKIFFEEQEILRARKI